jgi:hypothetical protein
MTTARFKRIKDYDSFELDKAIEEAVLHCSDHALPIQGEAPYRLDFWTICKGVDAYFEKRRRKEEKEAEARLSLGER